MARMLLVEDDGDSRRLMGRFLRRSGHAVDEAATGAHALAALADESYDLVLVDVRLPDIDGFEVVRRKRDMTGAAETPVVMVTVEDEDILPADVSVAGWVAKPFTSRELRGAAEQALVHG